MDSDSADNSECATDCFVKTINRLRSQHSSPKTVFLAGKRSENHIWLDNPPKGGYQSIWFHSSKTSHTLKRTNPSSRRHHNKELSGGYNSFSFRNRAHWKNVAKRFLGFVSNTFLKNRFRVWNPIVEPNSQPEKKPATTRQTMLFA